MIVRLVDGTYKLFRHFYGLRRFRVKGFASVGDLGKKRAGEEPEGSRMAVFEGWGELLCG
jgi:hypothetical protein